MEPAATYQIAIKLENIRIKMTFCVCKLTQKTNVKRSASRRAQ